MNTDQACLREAGQGPGVLCLHANASSSAQWRALMDRLAAHFHVLAADGYGAGKSPPWNRDRPAMLDHEVDLLASALERTGDPCALVGHSYGGAVALVAALRRPQRVRAIALYEPTLFALVDAQSPPPNDADGIRRAVADAVAALAVGQPEAAAEHFIDFWMGAGSWARMPEARRSPIAASIVNVQGWGDALFNAPVPVAALSALRMPVLLMTGSESPASSLGVARILAAQLARVETIEFQGLGHMGPVTHPERVNGAVERFLLLHHRDPAT